MRYHRIFHILVLSIILSMVAAFPAVSVHAAGEDIDLLPEEGEIGDRIDIEGDRFEAEAYFRIYFSSDKAGDGDNIDTEVTAYDITGIKQANADGKLSTTFTVPDKLTDGEHEEYVHGGDYYFYVTYHRSTTILDSAKFTVIGGEIEINPEEGQVGTEVGISGKRFGISQRIAIEYDNDSIAIASGDKKTDEDGKFTCTIIIPESTADAHTITAIDVSGNEPGVEFSVKPKITIDPTSGVTGGVIKVSGTGFNHRDSMTITFDSHRISTRPLSLDTNAQGSFRGSFVIPYYAIGGISTITASDGSLNSAEAELAILADINIEPATSQTSPGYIGMELTIYGTGFVTEAPITITYDKSTVATVTADANGHFSTTFTMPPSIAEDHTVTATDNTNTLASTVIMESKAPPIPVPLLPELAATAKAETYFDWGDVSDSSGITYTLQIGTDAGFTTIVLEQTGLAQSEYTIETEEKLEPTGTNTPYYWRVRAIDGAANEGEWTIPMLFYVDYPQEVTRGWILYIWIGLGTLLVAILGFWIFKRIKG